MHSTKNHSKSSRRKRAEMFELDFQMRKKFLCGACHQGFEGAEEYESHNNSEEHNYQITRKIASLVPGLGFCAACACQIQTQKGWESHILTDKHIRSIASLTALGIEGDYDEPLSCSAPGQIGLPINPNELDMKIATSHGYGHGGKMGPGVPIIGLDQITSKTINKYNDIMYTCQTCTAEFTFGLRGNHLGSDEHWLKYLQVNYPAWFKEAMNIPGEFLFQIKFKLMFYAHKVEKIEKDSESEQSRLLRTKFTSEATQKRPHNIGISREARDYSHLKPVSKHIAFVKAESNPPTTKAGAKGDVQSPHKIGEIQEDFNLNKPASSDIENVKEGEIDVEKNTRKRKVLNDSEPSLKNLLNNSVSIKKLKSSQKLNEGKEVSKAFVEDRCLVTDSHQKSEEEVKGDLIPTITKANDSQKDKSEDIPTEDVKINAIKIKSSKNARMIIDLASKIKTAKSKESRESLGKEVYPHRGSNPSRASRGRRSPSLSEPRQTGRLHRGPPPGRAAHNKRGFLPPAPDRVPPFAPGILYDTEEYYPPYDDYTDQYETEYVDGQRFEPRGPRPRSFDPHRPPRHRLPKAHDTVRARSHPRPLPHELDEYIRSRVEPRGPRLGPRGPRFEPRDPRFEPRGPRVEPRDPRFEHRGARFEPRGPRFEPRGPRFEPRGPIFEPRGPRFEPRGPRFEPRGPRFEPRGPIFEPKGPRFEPRGPRFEPGGPRFEPRGPRFEPRGPRLESRCAHPRSFATPRPPRHCLPIRSKSSH